MLGSGTGGEDIFGDGKTGLENLDLEVALLGGREPVADNLAGTFTFKTVSPRLSEKSLRELKSLYP